jgi:hypothetical protein
MQISEGIELPDIPHGIGASGEVLAEKIGIKKKTDPENPSRFHGQPCRSKGETLIRRGPFVPLKISEP